MRCLVVLVAICVSFVASGARAQVWPDLRDDAGVQGGGEHDAALVVGVTDYYNLPKIDGASQNAEDWQQWLLRSRKVPSTRVELLTGKLATREKIEKNLEQLAKQVGPQGTLWFIFIGHGAPNKDGNDGLLLGVDTDGDGDSLSARGVPQQRVLSLIAQGTQAHSVVVFDACFSGTTRDGAAPLVKGLQVTLPNRRDAAPAKATVLAASDSFAGPLPNADRPAFSYLLLGALRGWADDNGDKAVDVDEAHAFTRAYIQRLFKGSDRLPSKRGPSVVLAKNVKEKQPDMAALISGKCPSGWQWRGRECQTVECPAGLAWDGSACANPCPTGAAWNGSACVGTKVASLPTRPLDDHDVNATADARRFKDAKGIAWVRVPEGTAHLGCPDGLGRNECYEDEDRAKVHVDGFAIMETEATVAIYKDCVREGVCSPNPLRNDRPTKSCNGIMDRLDHPINCITPDEAKTFCSWAGGRLPHEKEWEYAAKSGTSDHQYPWGNDKPTGRHANFCDKNCKEVHASSDDDGYAYTAPVGSFPTGDTPWGLKDMAGNVWEWVNGLEGKNPRVRGQSWDVAFERPTSIRSSLKPIESANIGVRCVQGSASDVRGITWVLLPAPQSTTSSAKLLPFSIMKEQVTSEQYESCVDAGKCPRAPLKHDEYGVDSCSNGDFQPARCVYQVEAASYCRWIGARLPTEAEWEYAARSRDTRTYVWGDDVPGPPSRTHYPNGAYSDVDFCDTHACVTADGVQQMVFGGYEWTSEKSKQGGVLKGCPYWSTLRTRLGAYHGGESAAVDCKIAARVHWTTLRTTNLRFRCVK